MRKTVFILMSIFTLIACNNSKNDRAKSDDQQNSTEASNLVGGEKNEHGCLTSAGETWSGIKQGCVRIFSIGQRLNPIEINNGEAVISAFVLFNDSKSKLELFLPNEKETIILDKGEEEIYQNDSLKFDAKDSTLYINNERKYKAE